MKCFAHSNVIKLVTWIWNNFYPFDCLFSDTPILSCLLTSHAKKCFKWKL